MVNLDRVRALESGEEDETIVILDGGARLRMSRRYRKVLQERLGVRER
jgi:two-component system LytT family response regulator